MALKLIINISKKMPMPGVDYASTSASCSIEGEITAGQDPLAEAARLYHQAEAAVDTQLALEHREAQASTGSGPGSQGSKGPARSNRSPGPGGASRPPGKPGRSSSAGITAAQVRLVNRLIETTKTDPQAVCQHYEIGSLDQLSCTEASDLIDRLKSQEQR